MAVFSVFAFDKYILEKLFDLSEISYSRSPIVPESPKMEDASGVAVVAVIATATAIAVQFEGIETAFDFATAREL